MGSHEVVFVDERNFDGGNTDGDEKDPFCDPDHPVQVEFREV